MADEPFKPSGLCFSPDYKKCYVADTGISHYPNAKSVIWVYDVDGKRLRNGGNGTMVGQVTAHLAQANALPSDLKVEQANLEDVFLALTGKQIRS